MTTWLRCQVCGGDGGFDAVDEVCDACSGVGKVPFTCDGKAYGDGIDHMIYPGDPTHCEDCASTHTQGDEA